MPSALVALGANLGDRRRTLASAVESLRGHPQIGGLRASGWHETLPVGGPGGQGPFLNAAVRFETSLSPEQLHGMLQEVELALGRRRTQRWEARAIDLDILLYGDCELRTPALTIPHPRMSFRRFVLEPAAEVASDMLHPTVGWTIGRLLAHLNTAVDYIALLAIANRGQAELAQALAREWECRYVADPCTGRVGWDRDPPSQVLAREIQFLRARASRLASEPWARPNELAVSDFYLDEGLAYVEAGDASGVEAFRAAWSEVQRQVVQPKLLVVLDEAFGKPASPPFDAAEPGRLGELRTAIRRLASRRNRGPVLYAGSGTRESQFDEISAAIAAMR
jgi:2-amino-4-hydroxy-6-hydroxymethyldihydropteridine diphosphokinase